MPSKSAQNDGFRRLVERIAASAIGGKYQQCRLLFSCQQFESFLSERDLSFFHDGLESLWELGILRPIAAARRSQEKGMPEGLVPVDGSDEEYWVDVRPLPLTLPRRAPERSMSKVGSQALYHPFQVWQAKLVRDRLSAIPLATSLAVAPARTYLATARRVRTANRRSLQRLLSDQVLLDSHRLIDVLLHVAPISLPWVTHRIVATFPERLEDYWLWRRNHRSDRFLAEHDVVPEDFQRWHHDLALTATRVDPLASWFALTQQVELENRGPLERAAFAPKGPARLAQDLYLMAQIIRSYAREFLGLDLPEEDMVRWGPQATEVNRRSYGEPYVTQGSRDVRRRIARRYGLDSGVRLVWFVEGDTEIGFIRRYCAEVGIDLDNRGILLQNLKGIGGLGRQKAQKFERRLHEARHEEQFAFVMLDDEPEARARLRALARDGATTAGFRVWTGGSFETANFSDTELAHVTAKHLGLPKKHRFTGGQLSGARKQAGSIERAINACLSGSGYRLQKGCAWGKELALWALHHPGPQALQEDGERPIVSVLVFLFRMAGASFLDTVDRFVVDDSGRPKERSPAGHADEDSGPPTLTAPET